MLDIMDYYGRQRALRSGSLGPLENLGWAFAHPWPPNGASGGQSFISTGPSTNCVFMISDSSPVGLPTHKISLFQGLWASDTTQRCLNEIWLKGGLWRNFIICGIGDTKRRCQVGGLLYGRTYCEYFWCASDIAFCESQHTMSFQAVMLNVKRIFYQFFD